MILKRFFFLVFLIFPLFTFSQFEKHELKQDHKQRLQLIDSETKQVLFEKCRSIEAISGDFKNTDQLYKSILIIKQGNQVIIFDTKTNKTIESIKCDDITFSEVKDWRYPDETESKPKKRILQGKVLSKQKKLKNLTFLMNFITGKTAGYFTDDIDVRYGTQRKVLVYNYLDYSFLKNENFEKIHPTLVRLRQYENGYFQGKDSESKLWGVIDNNMEEIIPFNYKEIDYMGDFIFAAVDTNDLIGIIKGKNRTIIPFKYKCIKPDGRYCNEMCKILKAGLYLLKAENGYVVRDSLNQIIVPVGAYDRISILNDNFLWVSNKGKKGVYNINKKEELISCDYNFIKHYKGVLLADNNGKIGFLNLFNETLNPFIYESTYTTIESDSNRFYILETAGRKGITTYDGKEIVPFIYDDISVKNDFLLIKNKGLYGLLDKKTFQEILPIDFYKIDPNKFTIEKYEGTLLKKGKFTRDGNIQWNN